MISLVASMGSSSPRSGTSNATELGAPRRRELRFGRHGSVSVVTHRPGRKIDPLDSVVPMLVWNSRFDSAIPRFESWRPSQPVGSLRCDFQVWENRRHSGGLAGNGRVFGEKNRALPTEGGVFLDESLLHEFSISGI